MARAAARAYKPAMNTTATHAPALLVDLMEAAVIELCRGLSPETARTAAMRIRVRLLATLGTRQLSPADDEVTCERIAGLLARLECRP